MVVVSHDRYFLDKVVTRIWELHDGKIEVYPGNYSHYWRLRTEKAKVLDRQADRQADKIADLEAYIRKYGAGQRAKQAKDREKKLERIERVETMREIVGPVMGFGEVERAGAVGPTLSLPSPSGPSGGCAPHRCEPPRPRAWRTEVFGCFDRARAPPRTTLRAALAVWAGSRANAEAALRAAGVDPKTRGEQLDVDAFAAIAANRSALVHQ